MKRGSCTQQPEGGDVAIAEVWATFLYLHLGMVTKGSCICLEPSRSPPSGLISYLRVTLFMLNRRTPYLSGAAFLFPVLDPHPTLLSKYYYYFSFKNEALRPREVKDFPESKQLRKPGFRVGYPTPERLLPATPRAQPWEPFELCGQKLSSKGSGTVSVDTKPAGEAATSRHPDT